MTASPDVSIVVVSFNSGPDLPRCLASALAQRGARVEAIVVDNASADDSAEIARRSGARVQALPENRGFAAGANAGIGASTGRYVLTLNPDCRLEPTFCESLAARLDRPDASDVGSATGLLYRASGAELALTDRIDSAGIVFMPNGRHLDRAGGESADGRFSAEETVAGTTGAAGFYRRAALESVRISTGVFDEDFYLYREDADLALRLRRAGWRCLLVPGAVAYHRRRSLPDRRRSMPPEINFHSVKNRFLLRINNSPVAEFRALPTLARDLAVLGACLTVERSSLPAFSYLFRNRRRLLAKRREILARHR